MSKSILITGVTGFIGKAIASKLIQSKNNIFALVRPGTKVERLKPFQEKIKFFEVNLADIKMLRDFLKDHSFDTILHIGALRGGRKFCNRIYYETNVNASEQLMINALKNGSKFVFCSSVGVFGAIPIELPANNQTKRKKDNYYHYTKIQAEALLQKYILQGLNGMIIRPAITYGAGDYGFPFTLTKLIDKNLLFLPNKEIQIHLTNIKLLTQVFQKIVENGFSTGKAYNIADSHPIEIQKLANFISQKLKGKTFPKSKLISRKYFELGEKIAHFFNNELWIARFELISKNWYYKVNEVYEDFSLKSSETIPNFEQVIDWYKGL